MHLQIFTPWRLIFRLKIQVLLILKSPYNVLQFLLSSISMDNEIVEELSRYDNVT